MRTSSWRLRAGGLVLLALAITAGVANASGTGKAYPDPAGDAVFASDVTRIAVADAKNGLITFSTRLTPAPRRPGDQVLLFLNTDRKRSTGISGHDYAVLLDGGRNTFTVADLRSGTAKQIRAKTARSRCCSKGWVFSINRREIGNTRVFDFSVTTESDAPGARSDRAPNTKLYRYRLASR